MFLEQPHRTTRNYAALREAVGKDIFAAGQRLKPYYLSALAAYRLEFYFRNGKMEPKYEPARYHLLLAARLTASANQPPKATENKMKMEKYCEPILERLWDIDKAEELFAAAKEIIEDVAKGNFDRDVIRTEPFTKEVKSRFKLEA
jgi:hypothetical protein